MQEYFYEIFEKNIKTPLKNSGVAAVKDKVNVAAALVVHDRQDEMVGFDQAEMTVQNWDKAELQETNGFGHFRLMKNPQVVERVVEFISE